MPPRTIPTARQGRLGVELRKLREAAGVVSRDAAEFLGTSQAQMNVGGKVTQLDTAQVDTGNGSLFVDAGAKLDRHRTRLVRIGSTALAPAPSLDLIRTIAQQL
ncbi:hypothetical protein [Streptomyces sp. NPDC050564]|uniref:hypothetical protein n=1 Tax=Streptomyces sp. NPDC050564 TaxID=3365631 RepID=UPI00378BC81B